MSHPVAELNELLARCLGRNPYGEGKFRWEWSEDLVWPEFPTGNTVTKRVEIPLIGGGVDVECEQCKGSGQGWPEDGGVCPFCKGAGKTFKTVEVAESIHPEYRKEKMCQKLDRQWVITLWYAPEELAHWQTRFPGATYPARGYRINTNASLPSFPGGPREPSLQDTERFIQLLNEQRSQGTHAAVVNGMLEEDAKRKQAVQTEIEDEIADSFTAFMNHKPGARGGFVSFPSTQDEIQR